MKHKKKFIKENSNQQSDELIEEFLKSVNRGNDDECHGCKKAKNEQPKTNTPEVTAAIEPANAPSDGKGGNHKRRTLLRRALDCSVSGLVMAKHPIYWISTTQAAKAKNQYKTSIKVRGSVFKKK